MDLATSLGLGLAIFSLAASVVIEGGHLGSLFSVPASIIVFGGTIGATVIGFSVKELKNVPTLFKIGFMGKDVEALQMIQILVRFAGAGR